MNLTQDWIRLRHRIETVVPLGKSHVELGGRQLPWLKVIEGDELLATAAADAERNRDAAPSTELDPFWAATWRAAQGLDRFLERLQIENVRVLELGCGTGQAGIGAALRGARVTMTDAVGLALLVARLNATRITDGIRFRRLRWLQDHLQQTFPVIIGSDLVYDPNIFEPLLGCAKEHLSKGGRLYLSEPYRHTGEIFSRRVRELGWKAIEHDVDLKDKRVTIRVFECWLEE